MSRLTKPRRIPFAEQVRILAQWPPSPEMDPTTCWPSPGTQRTNGGYANVRFDGRMVLAHRLAWTAARRLPIDFLPPPSVKQIDHVARLGCTSRDCFNPAHLELVTPRENLMRGGGPTARNAAKTHCPAGHELSDGNLVPAHLARGWRNCWTCARERGRDYMRQRRAAQKLAPNPN